MFTEVQDHKVLQINWNAKRSFFTSLLHQLIAVSVMESLNFFW